VTLARVLANVAFERTAHAGRSLGTPLGFLGTALGGPQRIPQAADLTFGVVDLGAGGVFLGAGPFEAERVDGVLIECHTALLPRWTRSWQ